MRRLASMAAAAALVAAAVTVGAVPHATAATCSSAGGVSVVVDFSRITSGVETACVGDGGGDTAASLFGAAGHALTRVGNFPQAVCRVDGVPEDANCQNMPPADAYWGLFWSDGSGGWVYSSESVDALNVPDGGSVAFAWQDGGDTDQPGVAPPQHGESPSPSPDDGSSGGGGTGSSGGTGGGDGGSTPSGTPSSTSPSSSPDASTTPTTGSTGRESGTRNDRDGGGADRDRERGGRADRKADEREKRQPSGDAASEAPTDEPAVAEEEAATADPPVADESGLPVWVAPVGIAGLFAAAGAVALVRRRQAA